MLHYFLNCNWTNSPLPYFHKFFQVTSIAKFHKNVISCICLDRFSHCDNVLAWNSILILDFGNNKCLFRLAQHMPFYYFTSVQLGIGHFFKLFKLIFCFRNGITRARSRFIFIQKRRLIWDFLCQIYFTILTLPKVSIQINQKVAYFLHLRYFSWLHILFSFLLCLSRLFISFYHWRFLRLLSSCDSIFAHVLSYFYY